MVTALRFCLAKTYGYTVSLSPSPLGENETLPFSMYAGTCPHVYLPVTSLFTRLLSEAASVTPSGLLLLSTRYPPLKIESCLFAESSIICSVVRSPK